jgi:hypothetical protein
VRGGRFGVDLVLEVEGVHLHELMRVASVAVLAAELAAPVRVDGPLERHVRLGTVQDAARGDFEILNGAFGFQQFALGRQTRDAHECHSSFSPFIRLLARANFADRI